jgi:hypothetical protein
VREIESYAQKDRMFFLYPKLGNQKELTWLFNESIELMNILGSISSKQIK